MSRKASSKAKGVFEPRQSLRFGVTLGDIPPNPLTLVKQTVHGHIENLELSEDRFLEGRIV